MESSNSTKSRTPSRCREWERNRRNKFNDAISRLGEVVREINKALNSASKDAEHAQYPKVEIIEKAIVCLKQCLQEKTQLKTEILALQVKIEAENKQRQNKKDASTQVFIGINKKKADGKYVKILMLQKSKRKVLKEKPVLTTNVTVESRVTKSNIKDSKPSSQNLPTLLPKCTINDKKGPENTIVVLPATPYIFPQRQLLFPTVPPAFVLLDPNPHNLNKSTFSLVNRNNNDVTKTTMVNILPISAYSRPLSANKNKKSNMKNKIDVTKNTSKKSKQPTKSVRESVPHKDIIKPKLTDNNFKQNKENDTDSKHLSQTNDKAESVNISEVDKGSTVKSNDTINNMELGANTDRSDMLVSETSKSKLKEDGNITKELNQQNITETVTFENTTNFTNSTTINQKDNDNVAQSADEGRKLIKIPPVKETEEKDKENKLPNILDSSLCENAVDGGNARLELAEEFLAASPTAAFLMSFPLVSGNRADSPAEEPQNAIQVPPKDNSQRRSDITSQPEPYFEKPQDNKIKSSSKTPNPSNNILNKQNEPNKYLETNSNIVSKQVDTKSSNVTTMANVSNENPFLNLPMPSLISTNCSLSESIYGLEFDCNISKSMPAQSSNYVSNNNFFYKSDPFSTVKSTIYSTSSISSGHEFNSFGLYPCAMEKYASKNKTEYPNVEDNLMKIGSSRLTYDIDLGWSHKSFDFVNCTSAPNTYNKDNVLTSAAGPYSTTYNPFNPDFHVPLTTTSSKKDSSSSKPTSFAETITSFYSQPSNLWSEEVPFYTNNNVPKSLVSKHQNYSSLDPIQSNNKPNHSKHYDTKQGPVTGVAEVIKSSNIGIVGATSQSADKFTKKSPNKMHINWMTSEIRPMQNNCNITHSELKESHKTPYGQLDHISNKKHEHNDSNYFPISIHNFQPQATQEELQVWPPTRAGGTTEISIEPPPINLPTLVGDLALGPHDKKKNTDVTNRGAIQPDIQNCSNFFSVTQLMNRSTDSNIPSRYQGSNIEAPKPVPTKQNITHTTNESNRKAMSRLDSHLPQPGYIFNESKTTNTYEIMSQFSQSKTKTNKPDKSSKVQKNSYSAEALIRGGSCTQKLQDNNIKYITSSQKYNDYNVSQDNSIAQVSHFPPILDYSDNTYAGQQFSGTTLYNSTTNTISNSFYSNFMPSSSNLMSSNYTSAPFSGEFIDYNQTECNYTNHKYEELKMRNNATVFQQDKVPSNYKNSRRDTASKHKLECSKKDSSKKYQNKRVKLNSDIEDWADTSHLLWQNKTPNKRHTNIMNEEIPFPNYVGNQMPGQYQPDFFNSHLMPANMQTVGHNVDRSLASFPVTSRANFNLSTIFPEITMKVQ